MPVSPHTLRRALGVSAVALATCLTGVALTPASAGDHPTGGFYTTKTPTSVGTGGAATSVDPEASKIGRDVLARGGNAADAIISMAAALGVTEPYSSGIGGGGFLVYYDAGTGKVSTIDGRETAPASMPDNAFIDPKTGKPYNFTPELVTSGVSVGTPGTPATWDQTLRRFGTLSLGQALAPATRLARRGFVVDQTFRQQTLDNKDRFRAFDSTRKLFLPGGDAPRVGSVFRNRDLAATYDLLAREGISGFYSGPLADQIVQTVQHPPKRPDTTLPVPRGYLETSDLAAYAAIPRRPTHVGYRGLDVYGMPPASSGGITVGEALNILAQYDVAGMSDADALHHYLEASALSFADRGAYIGDPAYVHVPQGDLLSDTYAKERACAIDPAHAAPKPEPAGDVSSYDGVCGNSTASRTDKPDTENLSTTNLTASDRWGNVAEYTLTMEQTGGSGMVVPGRGFLLNNELTDFTAVHDAKDPNRIEGGKRPRSSISPTIVLKDGKPFLAVGSPGGSTIITTVLQILFNRIDRGMTLPQAVAAPRASQRNTADVTAEQSFIDTYGALLKPYGHTFVPAGPPGSSASEIGAATGIEFRDHGQVVAVSEPVRRGGGAALVVRPGG
jgi:gamma-glutamyltranspeptidase/glutathione hydrolase